MMTRVFGMLLTGFALAMAVLIFIEIIPPLGTPPVDPGAEDPATVKDIDINQAIIPPIFRTIEESGGKLVMQGTSEPEAVLTLLKNKTRVQQTIADDEGEWALEMDISLDSTAAYDVTLETSSGDRIWGDETVIRVKPPPPDSTQATLPLASPEALVLVTAPGGPSRIVQNPFRADPADGPLSMGPIDYDDSGGVIFSGRSTIPGRVRIYGNEQVIGETQISSAGRWFFIAADTVPEGPYNIAAELLTSNGVLSRVSVNLTRLPPSLGAGITDDMPMVRIDENTWQVRRKLAGGGAQYTAIFNPDVGGE